MILEKIRDVAFSCGDKIAVKSGSSQITYRELWEKSDSLANWINGKLGKDRGPIPVYGHKGVMMIVCFLACVKSGRAYCPIDESMADERVAAILNRIDSKLILATEDFEFEGRYVASPKIIEGIIRESETVSEDCWVNEYDIYYIIFTSGSTGEPKGVEITEGNLGGFVKWSLKMWTETQGERSDTFLNQAPLSFDLSVMDTYSSLCSGGTLIAVSREMQKDMKSMLHYIEDNGVTFWVSTPSFVNMCLAETDFDRKRLPGVRMFWFCGERLPKATVKKLMERFPGAQIVNAYGPTESTVAVSAVTVSRDMLDCDKELPIGQVKEGSRIRVDSETSELLISGETLAKGYFRDVEKTKKAFVTDGKGERYYRTGDRGRFVDKMLYYDGRMDYQVKFHGYRIELPDIEANMLKIDGVREVAVLPKIKDGTIRYLSAFVVNPGIDGSYDDRKRIREKLRELLPDYMVPKKIVFLDKLPMTYNGKTDRLKLEAILK